MRGDSNREEVGKESLLLTEEFRICSSNPNKAKINERHPYELVGTGS